MIPVQKDFPPERLRKAWIRHMRAMLKASPRSANSFEKWKLSQQRQSWLYAAIGGAVLCVVVFVVAGGCR